MSTDTARLTGTYNLDPAHSRLGFVARHAMVTKVRGSFTDVEGSGYFDADNPENSKFQVTVKATSVSTGNADRDAHLRSNDFFDMDTYPEITFVSAAVKADGDNEYQVTGDLTIKGVTKPITFDLELSGPVDDPFGHQRIGLEGSTTVNRKDWGVNWNAALEAGGVLVSEKVTLEFDVAAVKADG
ncbi:MAG TPA: YceI family protein [Acidimicrobiales bacterium]|jgi:polyisoprenoid-binding protein YceI|nr:YceI family protein [Acidimicrobiales bacterium]